MKIISIIISLVLAGIFIVSIINTYRAINTPAIKQIDTNVEAFDPALQQVSGFEETEKRISVMLAAQRNKEENLKTWIIILNLLVTIATGVTTLIATISTAKSQSLTFKATVSIAIIAFASTIVSFTQGQVNTSKETVSNKITAIKKIRDELEALKLEELPAQLPIINRQLDEI